MTPEQEAKKRKFEEDIVEMAVAEYYKFVDDCNKHRPKSKVRSEKEAEVFYYAIHLGVKYGINFATDQYMNSLKKFEGKKNGNTTNTPK
jgi:hypothetical protein